MRSLNRKGGDIIIINKLRMLNFGPYYKNHEITFHNNGNGIHIIRGGNGQGKTSIQRAVIWALYGKVLDRKGDEIRFTSLLNLTAKREDKYRFAVEIHFQHDDVDWRIIRTTQARSHQEKMYKEKMKIEVYRAGRIILDPELEIQRVMPFSISRFYFFDGEMLRDYEELLEGDASSLAILKDSIDLPVNNSNFEKLTTDSPEPGNDDHASEV